MGTDEAVVIMLEGEDAWGDWQVVMLLLEIEPEEGLCFY